MCLGVRLHNIGPKSFTKLNFGVRVFFVRVVESCCRVYLTEELFFRASVGGAALVVCTCKQSYRPDVGECGDSRVS